MKAHWLHAVLLLSLLACGANAQQSSHSSAAQPGQPAKPAEQIRSLTAALSGRWSTTEKYDAMFMTPKGGTGAGEQIFRPGPGGFTVLENYHSKTPAGELFGFGLIWWDQTKGLQHMWCINVYPTGCQMFPAPPQPGPKWDGKRLVLHMEDEQQGKKMIWHEVFSDITSTSYTQTVDIGESPNQLKRWLTIHAKKVDGMRSK